MKPTVYTVHAYRWGDRECHSYSVGVYRLHNAACVLGADGDEYGFEKLQRDAIAEIEHLREAVRSARADEAHCWASRVDTLAAQLRDSDARYMALLKAVADGVAMQPAPRIVVDLGRRTG